MNAPPVAFRKTRRADPPVSIQEKLLHEEDRRVELEPEQNRLALPEERGDPDVVANHLAGGGERPVKGHGRVQKPVDRQPPGLEIDAQITAEKQIGLARTCVAEADDLIFQRRRGAVTAWGKGIGPRGYHGEH